jgi:hypothetical protein
LPATLHSVLRAVLHDLFRHDEVKAPWTLSLNVQYDALISRPQIGEPLWANDGVPIQQPNGKQFYSKPVVSLINAATFSAPVLKKALGILK